MSAGTLPLSLLEQRCLPSGLEISSMPMKQNLFFFFLRSCVSCSYDIVLTASLVVSCLPPTLWVYSLCGSLYVLQDLRLLFLAFQTMWIPAGSSHFQWPFKKGQHTLVRKIVWSIYQPVAESGAQRSQSCEREEIKIVSSHAREASEWPCSIKTLFFMGVPIPGSFRNPVCSPVGSK